MFDITAQGSRDLSFSDFTAEVGGSNTPSKYVTHYSLYNGSIKLAEVAATNAAGAVANTFTVSAATVVVQSAVSDANNEIGGIDATEYAKWAVGDTLTITDGTNTNIVRIVTLPATYTAAGTSVVFSGTVTLATNTTVTIYNNRVHFNASQADTGDTVLAGQTVTAGQTMTLTVKADTSAVKSGVTSGTVSMTMSVPGTAGPLTTDVGGLTWTYSALNTVGASAHSGSTADGYPVSANTLSY
jgi:hypothetical protein